MDGLALGQTISKERNSSQSDIQNCHDIACAVPSADTCVTRMPLVLAVSHGASDRLFVEVQRMLQRSKSGRSSSLRAWCRSQGY